ncbi:hypothetical protein GPECTOR_21g715 [Gonium pectorale]|uniref:RRM domain-containing protein n=1 Tax=Gonium pectorale TaxID=33097 RepID=A0A150GI81_GONPE|nr:hypothetical protein GPECTOR_21g715 [Gonium pectorale]|eukprot:KXZ49489.1 hypothetical protein GPECTOR_21g715 [Gonium pectorale]
MFSQAGPIKSLRMVTDKDTGKPKGYGFCEFHDVQTAQSAVRNLNKYEINGRMLRVDFADEHSADTRGKRDKEPRGGPRAAEQSVVPGPPPGTRPIGREAASAAASAMNGLLGNAAFTGPSQDKISTVIAGMTPMQLFEILSQMRTLCQQNHAAARSILVSNPQLTKALFQAQVLLGMVKGSAPPPSTMASVLAQQPPMAAPQQPVGPPAGQQQQQMGAPPPHGGAPGQPPPGMQPPQYAVAPGPAGPYGAPPAGAPQQPPQAVALVGGMPGPMLIDPATGLPYTAPPGAVIVPTGQPGPAQPPILQAPPPQPQPQPQQLPPPQPMQMQPPAPEPSPAGPPGGAGGGPPASVQLPPNLAPQQAQVLQQVLSLTPAQIDALPPAQRQQVLLVRQQLGLGGLQAQ